MTKEKRIKDLVMIYIALIFVISLFYFIRPSLIGYVTITKDISYIDSLNLTYHNSTDYSLKLNQTAPLVSLKVSGYLVGEGNALIYLQSHNKTYLVFDSSKNFVKTLNATSIP